jgi:citrate synthase
MFVDAAEAARTGPRAAIAARLAEGLADRRASAIRSIPRSILALMALLEAVEVPPLLATLRAEVEAATGQAPNIDFALVGMARALALPADAPFSLFAVGRMAGWHAHAIEQLQTGQLIRPRARYIGERRAKTAT